ncbi:MAG: hypothetical protein IJD68_07710 [Ruminococcus sp.]|nr:hypothetical protein [Ruminococcus sp.]
MKKLAFLKILFDIILFMSGGFCYGLIEILWRRRTHISMIITGGLCFLFLYKIFDKFKHLTLTLKCVIGSLVITTLEFLCGLVVNIRLKLKVWDYSKQPLNLLGQICLLYSFLWGLLTVPISFICKKISKLSLVRSLTQKRTKYDCS